MENDSASPGPTPGADAPARGSYLPLFHAAWLFALGITASRFIWLRPGYVFAGVMLAALLCLCAAVRAQRVAWVPLGVLWCLLGTWCAEMEPQPAPTPGLLALSDGLLRTIDGTVEKAEPVRGGTEQDPDQMQGQAQVPSQDQGKSQAQARAEGEGQTQRVDVRLASIERVNDEEDAQIPASGKVRLTIRWPAEADRSFHCGERVRAEARLLPPQVYRDPGVWSRQEYLLSQGITSTATVNAEQVEGRDGEADPKPAAWIEGDAKARIRCALSEAQGSASTRLLALPAAMRALPSLLRLSPEDAIMLTAMVTGDRTFLEHSMRVGFERTGSFHMLVVSGFHLAIVAGCIFWIAKKLRLPRLPATLLTIAASFAYAVFTGFATPVQRSLWMVTLYLIGRLVYRQRSPMNTIGFAALCLLVASPRSLFDSGFQMTLLAVVSIGGIATPILKSGIHPLLTATGNLGAIAPDVKLAPREAQFRVTLRMLAMKLSSAFNAFVGWKVFPGVVRFGLRVIEMLVVAVVVELAMMLPMATYFHRITIFALPVNVLILPLLLVLMPAALLTLIALWVWPAAAVIPGAIVAVLLHTGVGLVHRFGSLGLADFRIPGPLAWQSAAFCALGGLAIVLAGSGKPRWAWAALSAAALVAVAPRSVQHPRDALLVEAIDVGQGDSILLITPDGKTLLVDGGGFGGGPRQAAQEFDIGEEVVSATLWARGIRRLDAVALSHAHSDHMGGLPAVLRNFRPAELWVGNNPPVESYRALLDQAVSLGTRVRSLRSGDALPLGAASINVLAPRPDYVPGAAPENNDSLVFRVAYGQSSVLMEGDAEGPVEQSMLGEPDLASTLLKVGHHGSTSSTRPDFLQRVSPAWAVISCGLRNRYGHPRPELLAELQQAHVRALSTDLNGAVCFRLDGGTVAVENSCATDR